LKGWEAGKALRVPPSYRDVDKVVFLGMGGSAIPGDLLAGLVGQESRLPFHVQRDYLPPGFTDARTLTMACSYSGETEETIEAFQESFRRKAKLIAITTGGALGRLAQESRIPTLLLEPQGEPRSAVGTILFALMGILQGLRIISPKEGDVAEAIGGLEVGVGRLGIEVPASQNPAKKLALGLAGKMPIVYAAEALSGVARRWKTQFNENSKAWAFFDVLPELDHNSVVGYPGPSAAKERLKVLFLSSFHYHARTTLRIKITEDLLSQEGIAWEEVAGRGQSPLSQMMSLISLGDFASYYLAVLNGVDPSPVKVIDQLKSRLAEGG